MLFNLIARKIEKNHFILASSKVSKKYMPKTATQRSREYKERIKLDSALHAAQKEKERDGK